jgi:hypothetical protein
MQYFLMKCEVLIEHRRDDQSTKPVRDSIEAKLKIRNATILKQKSWDCSLVLSDMEAHFDSSFNKQSMFIIYRCPIHNYYNLEQSNNCLRHSTTDK